MLVLRRKQGESVQIDAAIRPFVSSKILYSPRLATVASVASFHGFVVPDCHLGIQNPIKR